jgi:hypothetical protein
MRRQTDQGPRWPRHRSKAAQKRANRKRVVTELQIQREDNERVLRGRI